MYVVWCIMYDLYLHFYSYSLVVLTVRKTPIYKSIGVNIYGNQFAWI